MPWDNVPAKAFSLPVMIIAPMLLSSSYLDRASFSSVKRGLQSAFRALGRLRVTISSSQFTRSNPIGSRVHTQSDARLGSLSEDVLIARGSRRVRAAGTGKVGGQGNGGLGGDQPGALSGEHFAV